MKAWKRPDGRYELIFANWEEERSNFLRWRPGYLAELKNGTWTCKADALAEIGAEKVIGVITGPSSCGCEPAMFRWVGEREVARGNTYAKRCPDCTNPATNVPEIHSCDIIEVLGEPDIARAVYEAEFRDKIEVFT